MEGIRLNGTFGSYRESTAALDIDDDGRNVSVKPGDKVFVSFVSLLSILVNTYKPHFNEANHHLRRSVLPVIPTSSPRHMKSALTVRWIHTSTTVRARTPVWARMQT